MFGEGDTKYPSETFPLLWSASEALPLESRTHRHIDLYEKLERTRMFRSLSFDLKPMYLSLQVGSCLRQDLSGSSQTSDFNIGTPVATLPGTWRDRISAGTGWPGVSVL